MKRRHFWPLVVGVVLLASLTVTGPGQLPAESPGSGSLVVASDAYIFRLELQHGIQQDYTECLGLGSSNDIEETTGLTNGSIVYTEKTPGTLQWHNITLRRDGPSDPDVWQWRKAMEDLHLDMAIQDGSILVLTPGSVQPVARWSFRNGWPARLTFSGAREELVIVHEGLQRLDGEGGFPPPARR
jgi:phage tail-like protein